MIGNICVQVQRGDITTETTEAIVNSTNENLDLSVGAVSKAILQAGGRSIVDECQTLGRQLPGAVVITEAGKLRCNYIIHVVTVTQQTLEQSIMGILQLAEQNGIKSLSMPAIGTGGLGIDSNDVASKTFHVIGDFVQQALYQQNLRLIRITIFQQPIVGIFQQAMTDLLTTPRTQDDRGAMRKWFGAVGSTIRQAFMGPDKEEQTVLRKQFNTIVLDIYAGSQQNINGAIKHLEATMDQEFSDVVVDDTSVRKLSKEDMSNLNTLADSLNVKVYMVDTGSVTRLHIQGGPMDVMTVHKEVNGLLERIHDEERQEREAKLFAKNVRWLFLNEKEEFEEYDLLTTGIIERAFQHNKSDITLNIEEGQYKIDFKKMMESDLDNPSSSVVEVRRELKEGGFGLLHHGQLWHLVNRWRELYSILNPMSMIQ
ncbi:protein mono-ADP-ribosyltransferase PARP14-like [Ptychodera flava]|uniref:protein mono-ADP-ribosyltransferase PARP14-like n=1 Tax=Ptychodera flava TaxID=63121 RepID=UPI00396A8B7F